MAKRSRKNPYTKRSKMTKYKRNAMRTESNTRKFNEQVKNVLLSQIEPKHYCTNWANLPGPVTAMFHNNFYVAQLWGQGNASSMNIFPQYRGDNQNQFEGREYYMKGIKLSLQFTFPYDRLGTRVRIWYVQNTTGDADPVYNTFFRDSLDNVMLDQRNSKNWPKTKYLGEIRPKVFQTTFGTLADGTGTIGGRPCSVIRNYYLPFNKTFEMKGNVGNDNSVDPTNIPKLAEKGYLVMVAYNEQGALSTDQVVSNIEGVCTTYFKDP